MGDRSPATATVYDCPVEQAAALHKVIVAYFEQVNWDAPAPSDALLIGTPYTDYEMNIAYITEMAPLMVEAAPGASFSLTSDPYIEYHGDEFNYTPDLGPAIFPIDGDGNVVWTYDRIETFIKTQESGFGNSNLGLLSAFKKAMGGDYHQRWHDLAATSSITEIPLEA